VFPIFPGLSTDFQVNALIILKARNRNVVSAKRKKRIFFQKMCMGTIGKGFLTSPDYQRIMSFPRIMSFTAHPLMGTISHVISMRNRKWRLFLYGWTQP